jgi:hypothetical protein
MRRIRLICFLFVLVLALSVPASAASSAPAHSISMAARIEAANRALAWLRTLQERDGAFGSSVGMTLEVVLAVAAGGQDVSTWRALESGLSPVDYLATNLERYAVDAASTGKLIVALVAAGYDPKDFVGRDLVARLQNYHDGRGAYGTTTLSQVWAVLGLLAAGQTLPRGATSVLISAQQADGGWEGAPGWGTDSNTTALVLQALVAAGVKTDHQAISRGLSYLAAQQSPTGGFTYSAQWGMTADANSTAYVLQALIALGQNPDSPKWRKDGSSAIDDLLRLQLPNGAFEWQPTQGANLLATAQAIPALLGKVILPVPRMLDLGADADHPKILGNNLSLESKLLGDSAGAYAFYALDYPGDARTVTIKLSYTPADPVTRAGFGFCVYAPGGQLIGKGVPAADGAGYLELHASSARRARWLVQVYNYLPQHPVTYSVVATGLPEVVKGAPSARLTNVDAASAIALEGPTSGTLIGARAGAYAFYKLSYPGDGSLVTVRATLSPDDPVTARGIGLVIYSPSGEAIIGQSTSPGVREATFSSRVAGDYLIQIYNYIEGLALRFTLSR